MNVDSLYYQDKGMSLILSRCPIGIDTIIKAYNGSMSVYNKKLSASGLIYPKFMYRPKGVFTDWEPAAYTQIQELVYFDDFVDASLCNYSVYDKMIK